MAEKRYKMINGKRLELTAEEIKFEDKKNKDWADSEYDRLMASIRQERTMLLDTCDWMANSDVTMSTEWKTYRQKLRDITKDVDTVDKAKAVTMPEKPK